MDRELLRLEHCGSSLDLNQSCKAFKSAEIDIWGLGEDLYSFMEPQKGDNSIGTDLS